MAKTTIDIDEQLVSRAGAVLGTSGLKATVKRALEEVVAREARVRLVERLRERRGLELHDSGVMAQAWR